MVKQWSNNGQMMHTQNRNSVRKRAYLESNVSQSGPSLKELAFPLVFSLAFPLAFPLAFSLASSAEITFGEARGRLRQSRMQFLGDRVFLSLSQRPREIQKYNTNRTSANRTPRTETCEQRQVLPTCCRCVAGVLPVCCRWLQGHG